MLPTPAVTKNKRESFFNFPIWNISSGILFRTWSTASLFFRCFDSSVVMMIITTVPKHSPRCLHLRVTSVIGLVNLSQRACNKFHPRSYALRLRTISECGISRVSKVIIHKPSRYRSDGRRSCCKRVSPPRRRFCHYTFRFIWRHYQYPQIPQLRIAEEKPDSIDLLIPWR